MNIVYSSYQIIDDLNGNEILKKIERIGRVCYRSENKITEDSSKIFVANLIKNGHESVLEHESFTVMFTLNRAIANELVRHRLASYSQESTRYCNYNKKGLTFIMPPAIQYGDELSRQKWYNAMEDAERLYNDLVEDGLLPQHARDILPHSLATTIVMTANLREWRHVFKVRTANDAHPDIRIPMINLLFELKDKVPVIFDDIKM